MTLRHSADTKLARLTKIIYYIVIIKSRLTFSYDPWSGMSLYRGVQSPFGFPEPTEIQSSESTNFFGDPDPEIFLASVTLQESNAYSTSQNVKH
jgi:hypothetical protein